MPKDRREVVTKSDLPPQHHLRTLLIWMALGIATGTLFLALVWGWSEYERFVKRQKLTPIPVPAPP